MLVVLDTNVLVSGLLNGSGSPGKIIDRIMDGWIQVAYDDRILGEYEDVLHRPELHIRPALAGAIISYIELAGVLVESQPLDPNNFLDKDDLPFAEVFVTSRADALVSGNLRHFLPLVEKGLAVMSPADFLAKYFPKE
ncbi:PIN domain-containing protein (plasmid) [Leptolinea sp. HRD-7]|jgi:putative PIN family toxin of toxin-antitoxin system|nr:PIN domain-containing protein [Leptolinea sp. HRD-7]